jgi:hypothetical protein
VVHDQASPSRHHAAWFVPLLNRMPRDHRFALGERLISGLYDLLEGLVKARYSSVKLPRLEALAANLDLLQIQTRRCVLPRDPWSWWSFCGGAGWNLGAADR